MLCDNVIAADIRPPLVNYYTISHQVESQHIMRAGGGILPLLLQTTDYTLMI